MNRVKISKKTKKTPMICLTIGSSKDFAEVCFFSGLGYKYSTFGNFSSENLELAV
jgi:hypothetical protein